MVSADCEPISGSRIGVLVNDSGASPHVEHIGKSRLRILRGLGLACRFICARRTRRRARRFGGNGRISAIRWFGSNGKCADQWYCAGPSKRWWNEQCGSRSERGRKRFQDSPAGAAEHNRSGDSAVQVIAKRTRDCSAGIKPNQRVSLPRHAEALADGTRHSPTIGHLGKTNDVRSSK
jgi:hypothetical protein